MRHATCRSLAAAAAVATLVGACVHTAPDPAGSINSLNDGSGCAGMVGRYPDRGTAEAGRDRTLAEVLELDPETVASVPAGERAIDVRQSGADRYVVAISKTTLPDAVELFAVSAECVGPELRFSTRSRYESDDGVNVRRQQLRYVLIGDADGALVVQRELRERSLGLFELRRGGSPVDTYRFARQ